MMSQPYLRTSKPSEQHGSAVYASSRKAEVLLDAATTGGLAPSIFNTQPWRWRISEDTLRLYADRRRILPSFDATGHMLTVSCGAALHHARTALTAAGHLTMINRMPDSAQPDFLAAITVTGPQPATNEDHELYRSMWTRHTDRRLFAAAIVMPAESLARLTAVSRREGAHLHAIESDRISFLATAAESSATIHGRDDGYRADLDQWTHRPYSSGEGILAGTIAPAAPRPVPVRDFTLGNATGARLDPGHGDDSQATYVVLATDTDDPIDWLRAGEATSAVLLAITALGLAASPMSDVIEVPGARALVRSLLPDHRHPQLVLRVGVPSSPMRPPATPRRPHQQSIEVDADPNTRRE